MSSRDFVLAQGIAAARAGDRQAARRLLAEAAQRDPGSELAWLWLSEVLETPQGRAHCLQKALEINPRNAVARQGLRALEEARATRALIVQPTPQAAGRPPTRTAPSRRAIRAARAVHRPVRPPWPSRARAAVHGRTAAAVEALVDAYWGVVAGVQDRLQRAREARAAAAARRAARVAAVKAAAGRMVATATAIPRCVPRILGSSRRAARDILLQPRFWQVLIGCLAVVAVGLVTLLVHGMLGQPAPVQARVAGAGLALASPAPRGTLRPTFTATATRTPTATPTPSALPTSTPTPTQTETPTPLPTATHTATAESTATATARPAASRTPVPVRRQAAATAAPVAAKGAPTAPPPRPSLQPRIWDSRLDTLGVRVEPVGVAEGQVFWRLVEARWADEKQAAGKHSIYVEVLDFEGRRVVGQPVIVQWADGSVALPVENRPPPDWGVNFPMYNCLSSYAVSVGGRPSDRIVGLGLGTAEAPNFTVHTTFYLVFRLAQR